MSRSPTRCQAEGGTPVADVCRQMCVSEASFYVWKKKYGKLGLTDTRAVREATGREAAYNAGRL